MPEKALIHVLFRILWFAVRLFEVELGCVRPEDRQSRK